jgi:hypothetical protein
MTRNPILAVATFIKSKDIKVWLLLVMSLFIASSCGGNDDEVDYKYEYGFSTSSFGTDNEMYAIMTAYKDAFKFADLKFGNRYFSEGTKKEQILYACKEAEDAILTSTMKFDGKYVFEVKYGQTYIYRKAYGVSQ